MPNRVSQKAKLEELGLLASRVAHDLNNLLAGILGHVSYLGLTLPREGRHHDSLVAVEDGARRAAALTQQILDFSKGREAVLCPVNLSLVVEAGVNLLRASLTPSVKLTLATQEEDVFVLGDDSRLSQVIMNLIVNGKEALHPEGGSIHVSLEARTIASRELGFTGTGWAPIPGGNYASLVVKDDGIGIPETVRERIFEPYFTTKTGRGTGLGLATVSAVVAEHGGYLYIESIDGQGTTFELLFPLYRLQEAASTAMPERLALPRGVERILVVDDEDTVRMVLQRSLEHLGYEVDAAADGVEALEIFSQNPESYGLIVLDMIMPKMGGDEVFERMQEIYPEVAILISSGYSSDSRIRRIMDHGGLGIIRKPFAVEDLAREVRRCLDRQKS